MYRIMDHAVFFGSERNAGVTAGFGGVEERPSCVVLAVILVRCIKLLSFRAFVFVSKAAVLV